jgi:D-alanyl-D-alanine carboxypeptidase/D-alanyl-D-alanine-endopeptidase (penicillin-binding protein 4)
VIKSLSDDQTIYALNPRKLLMPASTMKVVTLAVAADRLGWDYRYQTRVLTVGTIEGGVLNGDLLVVGSGDPSLDDWDGAATAVFDRWAALLKERGIRSINGRVVGDDNAFDDDGLGTGWAWDDLGASYATSVGGLQYNENTARVTVGPGPAAGEPASIATQPEAAQLTLRNLVRTAPAGNPASVQIRLLPLTSTLELRGAVPVDARPFVRNTSVPNPTVYFANAVRIALARNGIDVTGPAVDIDDVRDTPSREAGQLVTEEVSAPLPQLATTMMKFSQNLYAETLLKTLGVGVQTVGSSEAGRAAIRATLERWNIPTSDMLMVDGSGLSRYNLITPGAMVAILSHIFHDDRLHDRFVDALPSAGIDGTLADRMKGTAASGNVRAKTGSFSNARAIAGFVRTAGNESLAFAIIANNYGVESSVIDSATDAIVVALAQFSER